MKLRCDAFQISVALLAVTAAGLSPLISALSHWATKEPNGLVLPLDQFDTRSLPSFDPAPDRSGFKITEDDVETDDVITIPFLTRENCGLAPRFNTLLFVTYYSDPRSQVAHTPEVCYRQAGATVQDMRSVEISLPGMDGLPVKATARVLDVRQQGRQSAIAYVFVSAGRYYHDRERLRLAIGWPGDKHTYFSKVEAAALVPAGRESTESFEDAVRVALRMLEESVPLLRTNHYPLDEVVRRGKNERS